MRLAAVLACVLLAGCELYVGADPEVDDVVDAAPSPDAIWCGNLRCSPPPCSVPLNCPAEHDDGKHNVCGKLWDVESGQEITAAFPSYAECGADGVSDGPCALELQFVDPVAGATPLEIGSLYVDDCGRFVAQNVPHPPSSYLAITVDDAPGAADDHRLTEVAFPVSPGLLVDRIRASSLLSTTDRVWAAALGLVDGSVVDHGAELLTYRDDVGEPMPGVPIDPADRGFADADPETHGRPISSSVTGANGSALVFRQGMLGPGECNAQTIVTPGVLFVGYTVCSTLP